MPLGGRCGEALVPRGSGGRRGRSSAACLVSSTLVSSAASKWPTGMRPLERVGLGQAPESELAGKIHAQVARRSSEGLVTPPAWRNLPASAA